jgi:hypothetical protein
MNTASAAAGAASIDSSVTAAQLSKPWKELAMPAWLRSREPPPAHDELHLLCFYVTLALYIKGSEGTNKCVVVISQHIGCLYQEVGHNGLNCLQAPEKQDLHEGPQTLGFSHRRH